jgi:hypothetical protein
MVQLSPTLAGAQLAAGAFLTWSLPEAFTGVLLADMTLRGEVAPDDPR